MTVFLLYALVPAVPPPTPTGARGERLAVIAEGDVAAVCEERADRPAPREDEVVGFAKVVSGLASRGPVLPMRFGTVLESTIEIRDHLRERGPEWSRRLEAVRGHVEMLVHVQDATAPVPAPPSRGSSGREYLMSRAAVRRHADALSEDLASSLGPHCRELRRLPGSGHLRMACLVPVGESEKLQDRVHAWAGGAPGRTTYVTGPWPPFSFTGEENP